MAEERIGLKLEPLDTLFFRDGRPFAAGRAVSGLPAPQTLTGAVRTHLLTLFGADFRALGEAAKKGAALPEAFRAAGVPEWIARVSARGPWLSAAGPAAQPFVEAPRHYRTGPNESRLPAWPRREGLPGWASAEGLLPLWSARAARQKKPESAFLEFGALAECLHGRDLPGSAFRDPGSLYGFDDKVGIAVDPATFVAADEMIYSTRMLALAPGMCLYAELAAPPGSGLAKAFERPGPMGFGGEARYVRAEAVIPAVWPAAGGERRLWLLAAPALFANGWRPDALPKDSRLVAAAVDGPFAVSGWDIAQGGPKPSRFGVRAGSVYFTEGGSAESPASLCGAAEDVQQGYGFCLKGTWNYA